MIKKPEIVLNRKSQDQYLEPTDDETNETGDAREKSPSVIALER
ncbi:6825_t:CDS:2 [Funneliformis geosporum]|uniref:792_t:CDS:1 n=1 Tax=Funneliformis geosporum TaxID=1117311 RepID=A0A9W4SRU1_9GLOM|nr:792_t:CDS:2 [Funneliformis geosporum]CAI2188683.1 6825_t:CDS:2 [Funneliformis geosporum]